MANRILLPNGCSMSQPSVFPKDWENGGSSAMEKDWRVQYYFYDPSHSRKKKLCIVKGMNEFKSLKERREVTRGIIQDEIYDNKNGFNPILKKFTLVNNFEGQDLHPEIPFITAFRIALSKMQIESKHRKEINFAINRIERKAKHLRLLDVLVCELKRSQMKRLLEACNLPDYNYNKLRGYFSSLYGELIEYECCETNIIRDIRKRKVVSKQREILSKKDHESVMRYLESNYYEFWRYARIFLFSGARTSELFMVQAKNVDIASQEFRVTIKKGKHHKEVTKVILKEVVPLWKEILASAGPNDYLFSRGLKPGSKTIQPYQITRRWLRHVKKSDQITDEEGKKINVTADFYALKHSFLDTLPLNVAQQIASHTNSKTTAIYRVNQEKRDRENLKNINIR